MLLVLLPSYGWNKSIYVSCFCYEIFHYHLRKGSKHWVPYLWRYLFSPVAVVFVGFSCSSTEILACFYLESILFAATTLR
jgi:hypothetical protein